MQNEYNKQQLKAFFRSKVPQKGHEDRIIVTNPNVLYMDLKTHMANYRGYTIILVVTQPSSRFTMVEPLKNKKMDTVVDALMHLLRLHRSELKVAPRHIYVDQGSEWLNSSMDEFLAKKQITLVPVNTYNKNSMALVESRIGVISKKLNVEMNVAKMLGDKSNDWITPLRQIVSDMNAKAKPKYSYKDVVEGLPIVPNDVYDIGEKVYKKIMKSEHLDGRRKFRFRNGDLHYRYVQNPPEVTDYLVRPLRPVRYVLDDDYGTTYRHDQLLSKNGILKK